jgi:hypothetical protein
LLVGPVATCRQGNGQHHNKTTGPLPDQTICILHKFTPGVTIENAWVRQNMLRRQDGGKKKMRTLAREEIARIFGWNYCAARRMSGTLRLLRRPGAFETFAGQVSS